MRPQFILNVAALSPQEIGEHTPHLKALAEQGTMSPLLAPDPALTSVSHATMMTGELPQKHGIVANGWYDREYAKILNWNRSDHLVQGEKLWEASQALFPKSKSANLFWRFCTHTSCDFVLTERPTYFSNGRKGADVYSPQEQEKKRLIDRYGPFPFFNFWGPKASLKSSEWIVNVALDLIQDADHQLILCYAPGLDYDGQRFGPNAPQALKTLEQGDALFGDLIQKALQAGYDVSVVSDYGFTEVHRPIFINRILRQNGYLSIENAANGELLEPGASKAFAVSDNQAAHIYVNDKQILKEVKQVLEESEGVAQVLEAQESGALGHPRSGQLLAIAESDAWFAYPYWLDEAKAPDFAKCVDIFSKPGFDPCEMFMKPGLSGGLHVAKRFAQLKLGIRAPFDVISPDPFAIRGARNIRPKTPQESAIWISSWQRKSEEAVPMQNLKNLWLEQMKAPIK